jgi:hypothetical protein
MTGWRLVRDGDSLILRDCAGGGGNYIRKMEKLVQDHPEYKGKLTMVDVCHDAWCAALKDGFCNCDPDLEVHR